MYFIYAIFKKIKKNLKMKNLTTFSVIRYSAKCLIFIRLRPQIFYSVHP